MRIAILGATSQIAKDLILSFATHSTHTLVLYARRPEAVTQWLTHAMLASRYVATDFAAFNTDEHFDAILNFVGVGNPAQAAAMGASIFDVTLHYDELALAYVRKHPHCRYLFLSSGAAYGSNFEIPADSNTKAVLDINHLQPQDWYGVAKLQAECRHRSLATLPIIDIRVFNYFSHTQDMSSRFLITEILRAIRDQIVFKTSATNIVRDFIGPDDFYQFVNIILQIKTTNVAIDCYSKSPIDKFTLLKIMQENFGLQYELVVGGADLNAPTSKLQYFSTNKLAANFGYDPKLTALQCVLIESSTMARFGFL